MFVLPDGDRLPLGVERIAGPGQLLVQSSSGRTPLNQQEYVLFFLERVHIHKVLGHDRYVASGDPVDSFPELEDFCLADDPDHVAEARVVRLVQQPLVVVTVTDPVSPQHLALHGLEHRQLLLGRQPRLPQLLLHLHLLLQHLLLLSLHLKKRVNIPYRFVDWLLFV